MGPGHRHVSAVELPSVLVIQGSSGWRALSLGEVWRRRELLYFFVWRDLKVRYKQTVLGAAWAILQPLFSMAVFALFFGKLSKMPSDGVPYPLFSFLGLLPWTYFSSVLASASNSLVGNAHLITKVYFPRLIVPLASVASGLADYGVAALMLAPLMTIFRFVPNWTGLLALPLLTMHVFALALGVGLWLSALNVRYRDIRHAVPFLLQLWMYATPIVYPLSIVPVRWRWAVALNPMAGIVEGYRSAVLTGVWQTQALLISLGVTLVVLVSGAFYFRKLERTFADVV